MSNAIATIRKHLLLPLRRLTGAAAKIEQLHQARLGIAGLMLEAPELDGLLLAIAEQHAGLADLAIPELEPVFTIRAVHEPAWPISDPLPDGRRILALRHPGFGRVGFVPAPERAKALL